MTGATHWLHVGRLQIGSYRDADGKQHVAIRGHCSVAQIADVLTAIRSVATCAEHAPVSTDTLYDAMVGP